MPKANPLGKIRTLLVDDMRPARERLTRLLSVDPEIELVGEAANGREAVAAIKSLGPDLVFLDVQMPKMSGFDVLETVGAERMPTVVFVTAFDEFALRAFELNALDYLLKPVEEERLFKSLERAKKQIGQFATGGINERLLNLLDKVQNTSGYVKRIAIKTGQHTTLVAVEDIDWIGGAGNYLEIHCGKAVYLFRERLHRLEQTLDSARFARIHRSTIVNIDRIKELHPMFNGDQLIVLHSGARLNLSRTYHERLLAHISR